jgi:hypothetical protein
MLGNGNAIRRTGIRDGEFKKRDTTFWGFLEIWGRGGSNRHWDGITGTGTGTGYAQSSEAKRIVLGNFFDSAFNNHSHAERERECV